MSPDPAGAADVLVLTQEFDPTVDPLVTTLTERGAGITRVDLSYFPQRMSVTSSDFDGTATLVHGERTVDLHGLSGVWYRRPTGFEFAEHLSEAEQQFARNEALHGVGGLLRATRCTWVNRPDADAVAELKPYHMSVAREIGMTAPRTLITNDPDRVRDLLATATRPIVYKALTGGVIHYPGAFPDGLYTTVLGPEIEEHLERVRHTVCTFQEYCEKDHEVRLTVIGDHYFPVRIASQGSEETRVDWRGSSEMAYGDYEPLPDAVLEQCQQLMARLGIVYGAIDFIVTPEGDYVFLEVNPNGQFMWLEHDLQLGMVESLADLLTTPGEFVRRDAVQHEY